MICKRCGVDTPRLTLDQRYCPTCDREVRDRIRADAQRRRPRFSSGKDLTPSGTPS